jgi:zinc protease
MMRAFRSTVLLAALVLAGCATISVPPLGAQVELKLPEQQKFTLPNGLAVRLVESHRLPIVAVRLVMLEGGAARDPAGLPGVANFTASMVTEGTASWERA